MKPLDIALQQELDELTERGVAKRAERVIREVIAPTADRGVRYLLEGEKREFIRMNTNSYLNLSLHPALIQAADEATHHYGVGPGAVRFIDGTFSAHTKLESDIASFTGYPAAKIFNSAYTSNCGMALAIGSKNTHWIGDQLNHNSIIRAMRIAGVARERKSIYKHNDMTDLRRCLDGVPGEVERVIIIFDGIFSMRGDCAPVDEICALAAEYNERFRDGVITVMDDSHGIGAYGKTGRGTAEHTSTNPDIIVGTFGKAFGVNGGFIAASKTVIEAVRQKADTYIYTNPLSVADCAAASRALELIDSTDGATLLAKLKEGTDRFRRGLDSLGLESIPGPHPVVPLLVRDTAATHELVRALYEHGVLVVGLTFPVVPQGEETIRFQINCGLTMQDIDLVLNLLKQNMH